MTSVRALLTTGSVYTTATAIQLSGAVLVIPAVTRLLGPAEYGELTLGLIVLLLLGLIAAAGLPGAITRLYFREDEGGRLGARRLVPVTFALALVVSLVAELTGPHWAGLFGGLDYDGTLRIAVWGAPAAAMMAAAQGLLRAEERAVAFVVVAVLSGLGGQLAGLALIAGWDLGPSGFMAGVVGAMTLAAVLGTVLSGGTSAGFADRRTIAAALIVGLPTVPHSLAGYLLATGDRIAIERKLDLDEVGRYQAAYAVGSLGILVLSALNNAWAPLIYRAKQGERWRVLAETTAALYPLAALAAGGLALLAPLALMVAAPPAYDPADLTPVSAIVAFAVIPYITYLSAVHIVFWRGRTGVLALSTPIAAAVNLALVLVLVGPLGLEGAALATVVAYGLLALLVHLRARRMAEVPWRRSTALRATAIAAALTLAGAFGPTEGLWLGVRGVAGAACLVSLLAVGRRLIAEPAPVEAPH